MKMVNYRYGGSDPQRLDTYLASKEEKSRSYWQKRIKDGLVLVNGRAVKTGYLLAVGDEIQVINNDRPSAQREAPQLEVLYEDDKLLVINKPAGVLVHDIPGREGEEPTVAAFARAKTSEKDDLRAGIVHRLDKDTSGIMLLAKDAETKEFLQNQFRRREVKKTYIALLQGRLKDDEAVIDLPIARDAKRPLKRTVLPTGKPATTAYKVLAHYSHYTLIEAYPKTGRTHQLRVHFSYLGHPIAGDTLYGETKPPKTLSRQFLHAKTIMFKHPSGKSMSFTAELPENLVDFLKDLD